MAGELWGQLGNVLFQYLKSPRYGSVSTSRRAKFSEHERIITKPAGVLEGQKPILQIAGLERDTWSMSFRVAAIVLTRRETTLGGRIGTTLGLGGAIAGSAFGNRKMDMRFYENIPGFIDELNIIFESQEPANLVIGNEFKGQFVIDSMNIRKKHYATGVIYSADIDVQLSEWIDPEAD